jgi:hypothetical protein
MQSVLNSVADQFASETGFVQRRSKMSGAKFAQTLVFGWMSNPQATLEQMAQTAASLGVTISAQGLDDRFQEKAANFMQAVLGAGVERAITAHPATLAILGRFQQVVIQDSTVVQLPEELMPIWQGCGSAAGKGQAAIKAEVRWELKQGRLWGPYLEDGRVNENRSRIMAEPVTEGALFIADLGYWNLERMQAWSASGSYWLSYLRFNTVILDENQHRQNLLKLLQAQQNLRVERQVFLGEKQRVPARLIAVRVRQQTADRRRQRIYDVARRTQRPANQEALALADWTILVTNVPASMLTLPEATNLIRVRWQVELLFKLWKSHGQIDEWRSHKPWRILCEIYAKLLTLLIQHWLFLASFWEFPNRSLFKGAQTIQRFALALAISFANFADLVGIIEIIQCCLSTGCRINRSSKQPHSFQLLETAMDAPLA